VKRYGLSYAFALLALLILVLSEVVRLVPFGNDISPRIDRKEDWFYYDRYADSVVRDGPAIKAIHGPYLRPGGFGYVYFVALCYRLFGERAEAVYAIQMALAIGAVLLYLRLARDRLTPRMHLAYAAMLVVLIGFDVWTDDWPQYGRRLLSENLLLPLLAATVWAFDWMTGKPAWWKALVCGVLCGACFLVRPNTLLLPVALMLAMRAAARPPHSTALFAGFVAVASLIVWRDHAVGAPGVLSILTSTADWPRPHSLSGVVPFYLRNLAFVLGIHSAIKPMMYNRVHWFAAWIGAILFAVRALRTRAIDPFDRGVVAMLAAYFGPIVAVHIAIYGYRMLFPAMPLVFYLAARSIDRSPREA